MEVFMVESQTYQTFTLQKNTRAILEKHYGLCYFDKTDFEYDGCVMKGSQKFNKF